MNDLFIMNNSSFCEVSEKELLEVDGGFNLFEEVGKIFVGEMVEQSIEAARNAVNYVAGYTVGFHKAFWGK